MVTMIKWYWPERIWSSIKQVYTVSGFELWQPFKLKSACLLSLSHSVTYSSMFEKNSDVNEKCSPRDKHSNVNIYYSLACEQEKAITAERRKCSSSSSIWWDAEQKHMGTEGQELDKLNISGSDQRPNQIKFDCGWCCTPSPWLKDLII